MAARYVVNVNDVLSTSEGTFQVTKLLGYGVFGSVVKCLKVDTKVTVAVKFIRPNPRHPRMAEEEIATLSALGQDTADDHNLVRFFQSFTFKDHTCLIFESLDQSLFDFLYKTSRQSFPLRYIRPVAFQLLTALHKLSSLGIIHSDLKPQNIMLVNTGLVPYKIKLIDFGCAFHASQIMSKDNQIQTLNYRAPEILLGLPFTQSIDIWSLGCVIAELFLRSQLYKGWCAYDIVIYITKLQGPLPASILDVAQRAQMFFVQEISETGAPVWRLKQLDELPIEMSSQSREMKYVVNTVVLHSFLDIRKHNIPSHLGDRELSMEIVDRRAFVHLLRNLMKLESASRITPLGAIGHPFFTFKHLTAFTDLDDFRECSEAMQVCSNYPFQA